MRNRHKILGLENTVISTGHVITIVIFIVGLAGLYFAITAKQSIQDERQTVTNMKVQSIEGKVDRLTASVARIEGALNIRPSARAVPSNSNSTTPVSPTATGSTPSFSSIVVNAQEPDKQSGESPQIVVPVPAPTPNVVDSLNRTIDRVINLDL